MAIKLEITGDNAAEFKTQLSGVAEALLGSGFAGWSKPEKVGVALKRFADTLSAAQPAGSCEETAQEQEEAKNTMLDSAPEATNAATPRKRRTKAEIEADKAKELAGESASSAEVGDGELDDFNAAGVLDKAATELEVSAGIQECTSVNDLGNFYHANSQMIDGSEGLKAGFKKKQAELQAKEAATPAEQQAAPEQSDEWPVIEGVKIDAEVLKALAMKKRDMIQARGTQQDAIKTLQPILERHDIRAFSQTPPQKAAAVYAELIALS